MNLTLIPRPLSEWFSGLCDRFFFAGVGVSAERAVAGLEAEAVEVKKDRVRTTLEALDYAREIDTEGDEFKERVLAEYREDLLAVRGITAKVVDGRIPLAEGREALRNLPPGSGGSATSSPAAPPRAITQADGSPSAPTEPPRRKRGRPPKHRPQPEPGMEG
jgi:hypothetical protein